MDAPLDAESGLVMWVPTVTYNFTSFPCDCGVAVLQLKQANVDVTTAAEGGLRKIGLHTKNSQAARSQAKHEQPRMAGWAALSQAYQLRIPGYP